MYEYATYKGGFKIMDLRGRSFLTLLDYTEEEINYLLELSKEFKTKKKGGNRT